MPSHQVDDDPIGAKYMRRIAAEAREERSACILARLSEYLTARANQADCEAAARERSLERMAANPDWRRRLLP